MNKEDKNLTGYKRFNGKEELANAVSHMTGAMLATAGLVLMVVFSAMRGDAWHVVSTSVFGGTMVLLYLSSSIAHALRPGKLKEFFFIIDQMAIFLLIAGTYTPLALLVLRGPLGWTLFGLEWGLAVTGILLKALRPRIFTLRSINLFFLVLYVVMGWLFIIAIVPIINTLPLMGWLWILIGGIFYSVGIYFFKKASFTFHHLVWHLLVIAGSISHFFAIFFYMIP